MKTFLCVALGCVLISIAQTADPPKTLNIIVLEGAPKNTTDEDKTLIKTNIDRYFDILKNVKPYDILVLPEYGLTGRTDDKSKAISLTAHNVDMAYLKEKAWDKKIILVASLLEKDGNDLYSTTVVLNGNSNETLAKYRKTNLDETEQNLKSENEIVTFTEPTSGITIGLLSGDDILYDQPASKLLDKKLSTIIYTSSMKSIAPFKTAVSLHAGFAKAHGVNLLVASLSDPVNGVSGSGIYQPCAVKSVIYADQGTRPVAGSIQVTPITNCTKDPSSHVSLFGVRKLGVDQSLSNLIKNNYHYEGLQSEIIADNVTDKKICDGSFCCQFSITSKNWNQTNEYYRLVAGGDQKVCGLISCTDNKAIATCGNIDITPATTFDSVSIKTSSTDKSFVPYILHKDLTPKEDLSKTTFETDDTGASFATGGETSEVIAIAIVGAKSGANPLQFLAASVITLCVLLKQLI